MGFFDFMTEDIAIDLGTANTLIIHNDKVVIDSPSIVARDRISGKIIAVGKEANMMQGKTHENIKTIRPLKDGVIADFDVAQEMIRYFIAKVHNRKGFAAPQIIICIDIMQPKGNMIVDIGGGTTEIAVIALGGIVCDKSVKIAGDVFTNDIVYYMRTQHNLFVGESTAEKIKITIGAALEELETPPDDMSVQGRDLLTGKPKQVDVSYREIAKALDKSIQRIEDAVMETLSQTPPELAADIYNTGIYLAGGGSMLRGLDKRISQKTDLPVYIAEDPLRAVVRGTGMALKNIPKFRSVLIK